jgi:adenylate cyclase
VSKPGGPSRKSSAARPRARVETLVVAVLTLLLVFAYLAARDSGPFQAIEGQTLDWRFRLRGPQAVSPEIAIVAIDDRTLAELGRWPFSRRWLAAAVERIAADGANSIVFDLLLVGRERGADPGEAAEAVPPRTAEDGRLPEGIGADADRALADAFRRAGKVVVPFAFVYESEAANASALPPTVEQAAYPVVHAGAGQVSERPDHPAGALLPLATFLAAGNPAHATVIVDADGSLRFLHPAIRYGDSYYPSLAVEAVRQFRGLDRQDLLLELGRGLSIGDRFFATGSDLALPINYAGPEGAYDTWSLIDVAKGNFAPGTFRGRLVLLGPKAAGLSDRFETPYSPGLTGVEMLANVVDNLLGRGFLRRTSQIESIDLLAIVLAGSLAASLGRLRRPASAMLAVAALFAAWSAAAFYAFIAWQVWLNYLFPSLALLLGATVVTAGLAVRETRGRAYAERRGATLSRYVSPLAIAELEGHDTRTAGDRTRTAAVMFTDLVGFTRASEELPPAEVARLLHRFHGCVERIAGDHGGVVDKFIGDAVLVVFGMSEGSLSDAADALTCARRIVEELEGWQTEAGRASGLGLACGIGIDYGAVSIAEVGGSAHAQVTVAGDTVNVASRLEALTRDWSTKIIISDAVFDAVHAAGAAAVLEDFRELPVHKVRGRDRSVRLWAWPPAAVES